MSGAIHASRPAGGVVLLEIDNPPVNALGAAIRDALEAEIDRSDADLAVRVIVLTGRGKAFCAGDDLGEARHRGDAAGASLAGFGRLLDKIERARVPVIAAVNGPAVGGGLELALACTLRLAADKASFLAAGVNVGLMASVWRLPRLIGVGRASAMILTGSPLPAARALEWGVVTEAHPSETLLDAALALAKRIASRAPLSVEASKRMIRQALDLAADTWSAAAARELPTLLASADHQAGIQAALERRPAVFNRC